MRQLRTTVALAGIGRPAAVVTGVLSWLLIGLLPGLPAQAGQKMRVTESPTAITVQQNGQTVLVYNKQSPPVPEGMNPLYHRSGFLHPVNSPLGRTVTAAFPADHPHQHGIFSAWVRTTWDDHPVDFWNLAGGTGRVLHEQTVSVFSSDSAAGFEVDLLHRVETQPPVNVLRERWKITARAGFDSATAAKPSEAAAPASFYCFDLDSLQQALTDRPLIIHEYHYGGFALRGPTAWLLAKDSDVAKGDGDVPREPGSFLNSLGHERVQGNHEHVTWVAMTGMIDGRPVSIAVLSHPDNFRAPQAARIHPTKPYFCFSPCVDGEFQIDRSHPLRSRYRFLVRDTVPDAEFVEQQWKLWLEDESQ